MMTERFTLFYLFLCIADIYMLYRFLTAMFEKRYKRRGTVLCFLLFAGVAFLVNFYGTSLVNLLSLPLICFLYTILEFRVSIRNGIIYTLIFYAIFAGGETALEMWRIFLTARNLLPIISWEARTGAVFLLISYTFRFVFLLFIEKFIKKIELNRGQSHAWYLLIVPIVSLTILSSFMYMEFPEQLALQLVISIGALLLYFLNAAMFLILEQYTVVMNRIKAEELHKAKQEMEEERIQSILRLNESYRCYMHDVHAYFNHLRMLALEGKNQEIVEVIDDVEGKVQEETKESLYSGNSILNAILAEREMKARRSGINMNIFVENFLKIDFISPADMISMFGNLMDNALEAALKCEEGRRNIDVKFFMGNRHMLVMHIENNFAENLKRRGDRLLTSKRDVGQHGLGIGIVKKIAEKYGGALGTETRGNIFAATLTISACR